ncbi:hypothetical protein NDU88_009031 [Pleurodeles waltl]|uniref:Uncharacterized protein n=1 Tax=Pleurodeles waltl TaxID=8319 RepID=A0AAV7QRH7_PLEWA|nr:hypothetical protein NDU88_009031 [Pleurodeles waltl]
MSRQVAGPPLSRSTLGPTALQAPRGPQGLQPPVAATPQSKQALSGLHDHRVAGQRHVRPTPTLPRVAPSPGSVPLRPDRCSQLLWGPNLCRSTDRALCLLFSVPHGRSTSRCARGTRPRPRPAPPHTPATPSGPQAPGRSLDSTRGSSLCPSNAGAAPPEGAQGHSVAGEGPGGGAQVYTSAHAAILATPP